MKFRIWASYMLFLLKSNGKVWHDKMRVTNCSSYLLQLYALRVAFIVWVMSCELRLLCELRAERKMRVGNLKCKLKRKLRVACFLWTKARFAKWKRYSTISNLLWVSTYEKRLKAVVISILWEATYENDNYSCISGFIQGFWQSVACRCTL